MLWTHGWPPWQKSFMRLALAAIVPVAFVVASAVGCTGSTISPENADSSASVPTATATESALVADDPPPAPGTALKTSDPSGPTTRELSASDCRSLAEKYNELLRSDEMAKLSPKLTDAQREQSRVQIGKGMAIMSARWEEGCARDLTGKLATEASLQCAMAAKTVATFDVCINGPATSPP